MSRASQRRAIALLTFVFILLSAALHGTFGSLGTLVHFKTETPVAEQRAFPIIIQRLPKTPTPHPTPTPTPPPVRLPPRPQLPQAPKHPAIPLHPTVHAPTIRAPTTNDGAIVSQPQPTVVASATPQPATPETPTPVETPIDARDQIIDASFRHEVKPRYPEMATVDGAEGTVVVLLTIGPDGNVLSARVAQSSGSLVLDQEALYAAKASSYYPPEIDGKPAIMTYRIVYTFQLS